MSARWPSLPAAAETPVRHRWGSVMFSPGRVTAHSDEHAYSNSPSHSNPRLERSTVKRRLVTVMATASLLVLAAQPAFAGIRNIGF